MAYTMEFLISNGVKEVFVITQHKLDKGLEKFIQSMKYKQSNEVIIRPLMIDSANNAGDVLRELEQLNVIKSDFLLLRGDIVSNINLRPALLEHFT